jgi:hypothetical protein
MRFFLDPALRIDIDEGLASSNEAERWDMAAMLALHVEASPEEVWAIVARWGCSDEPDTRMAMATCVLEHLLEHHFELIFPRVEALALADARFADTFSSCWKFGQNKEVANSARFEALLARLRPGGVA